MDSNNNVALSDAERNKELFEYEMTEVLLQLKGEFAKFSGKDLKLETTRFAAPEINIQDNIPDIVVEQIKIDTPDIGADLSRKPFVLPDVDIRKTDINYREAPAVSAVIFDKVKISSQKTDHLNAVRPQCITIEPVGVRMPEINAEVPLIGKADDISDVTVQIKTVDIPETKVSMHDLGEVSVRKISVDIPETEVSMHDLGEVSVRKISVDIPETEVSMHDLGEVSVRKISVDIPETEVSMHDLGEVSVRKISVAIPDTVINTGYRSAEISVSRSAEAVSVPNIPKNADIPAVNVSIDADIPTVKLHSAVDYAPVTVKMKENDLIAAEIQQIRPYSGGSVTRKTAEINDVSVRGITAVKIAEVKTDSKKIDVPQSISVSPVKNIAVNVEKAKIDHDCPAIKTVEISPVTIRMTDRIAVPEKPDFSGEIQSILESIV
ncbi:hypothetical protein [Ruminococcus sp.]|uniref:hypothetical protein n=1 Tax=Ruminococcus sp. TaxID=41978 RepID=UPI0025E8B69C|nr:hypothetical protein [Ruminococcus sp.]MBQ6251020.1 hypothetical protein [Ruminococcus sp.]